MSDDLTLTLAPRPTPHNVYFMKDGVIFLVENTLFRVPRYMLENASPVLATLLSNVPPTSDPQPIPLADVTALDFERLLALLYPLTPSSSLSPLPPLSESHWTSILRLSTQFEMSALRTLSMHALSHLITDPLTKIQLGRQYDHTAWIQEGFTALCVRREAMTVAEAAALTKEDVVRCASAREEIRSRGLGVEIGNGLIARPREQGWKALISLRSPQQINRVLGMEPQSQTLSENTDPSDYQEISNTDRVIRRIVNRAFEFPLEPEVEDEAESSALSSKEGKNTWSRWSLPRHFPDIPLPLPTPRILWLIYSQNVHDRPGPIDPKERWTGDIRDLKDIPDSASIMTVAEMERNWPWICPFPIPISTLKELDLRRYLAELDVHVRRYLTPARMSYGAVALSVSIGVLILDLIPH